jgi:sigma-B regulation protein RsbU (phosphoserine phosphatase)
MRRNINVINQSRFVRQMNQEFAESSELEEFATALVCTFFSPSRTLQFCNAGHPVPLLRRADQHEWVPAQEAAILREGRGISDTPLGAIEEADYSNYEVTLGPGDLVLCVSDAFTESFDSRGETLGTNGLLESVQALDVTHPETIVRQLTEQIAGLHPGNLSSDDASLLLFRADGSSPSIASDLIAPFRLLRPVVEVTPQ